MKINASTISVQLQGLLWAVGIAWHNPLRNECTPDFNCCNKGLGRKNWLRFPQYSNKTRFYRGDAFILNGNLYSYAIRHGFGTIAKDGIPRYLVNRLSPWSFTIDLIYNWTTPLSVIRYRDLKFIDDEQAI